MDNNHNLAFILIILLLIISCTQPTEHDEDKSQLFLPTIAKGPGGSAYIAGNIKDYIHRSRIVPNTSIYVMNQQDYSDTLAYVYVTSTNASFEITDLPTGKVDLIFMNDNYLCGKIGKLNLVAGGNSFYNPFSSGYFIDSTVYITNIADSVGRPDAPQFGLQGYGPTIGVFFKWETADSLAWQIVQSSGCDTLQVFRYDDPVFDPFENDVYDLKVISIDSVVTKLKFFNWQKDVKEATPGYLVIQQ